MKIIGSGGGGGKGGGGGGRTPTEDKDNLDRPFMSERSQPFQDTKTFAERVAKDISLGVSKI